MDSAIKTNPVALPHPIVTVVLLGASILAPLALAALAGCQAAAGTPTASPESPRIQLVCRGDAPQEIAPPLVEAISLDRLSASCTWQGVSFPIFGRRTDGPGPTRYDAIYYRPPLRPVGPPRTDTVSDPSGSLVRLDLETQLPSLRGLCDGVGNLPTRLLDGAQPLAMYALDVSFESPIVPGDCHLGLPGVVHHVGDVEVVRLQFSSPADAKGFVATIAADPTKLALRVRYAVAGVVNVPTTQLQLGGAPLAVAWFEELVQGTRSCSEGCLGCCDERGTCHQPQTLTRNFCALDEPGGRCGACSGFSVCEEAVCRDADLAEAAFDLYLTSVRIEGYSNCDTFSACDFTTTVGWFSLEPGLSDTAGSGPTDADTAWLGVRMAQDARPGAIQTPFRVRVYDRDLTEEEGMTSCSLMLEESDLQRAIAAAQRYEAATLEWACGGGIYLTFSLEAAVDGQDVVVADRW